MKPKMPVVFIGHGSPMNAIQDNEFTRSLRQLGKALPRPEAVLVVSAHWQTRGTQVTTAAEPKQIYDFGGFPDELYEVVYPAKGSPAVAAKVVEAGAAIPVRADAKWGIDHGAWAVLRHVWPKPAMPVLQLSLDLGLTPAQHFAAARQLAALRAAGVLVVGSGNVVHNLELMGPEQFGAKPFPWATAFDRFVMEAVERRDSASLIDYAAQGEAAALSVPTNEHYLPLLYVEALRADGDRLEWVHEGLQHRSLSMRTYLLQPG
jgi:4,5-DOPA dioxygenase extradiol